MIPRYKKMKTNTTATIPLALVWSQLAQR